MTTTPILFRYRHRCVHACFAAPEGSGRRHSSIAMALRAVPDRNHLKYDRHVNRISNSYFSSASTDRPNGVKKASFPHGAQRPLIRPERAYASGAIRRWPEMRHAGERSGRLQASP